MSQTDIVVSICCITYNHEKFIRDAIKGFLMQKTTFPIEVIIHDDASTDSTSDIIREYEKQYPQLIKSIYQQENQYSKGKKISSSFVWPKARGKYIALCEGDDFWIDPYKLQKQVDFLDANPAYGMVHGLCRIYDQRHRIYHPSVHRAARPALLQGDIFEALLICNYIHTCTVCFRRDLITRYFNTSGVYGQHFKMGDYPLWLEIAKHTKIGFIADPLATYRMIDNSAVCHNRADKQYEFVLSSYDVKSYFANKYNASKEVVHNILISKLRDELRFAFELNRKEAASKAFSDLLREPAEALDFHCYVYYLGTRYVFINHMSKLIREVYYALTRVWYFFFVP